MAVGASRAMSQWRRAAPRATLERHDICCRGSTMKGGSISWPAKETEEVVPWSTSQRKSSCHLTTSSHF